ncbi:TPA: phage tail protein, partial [Klebsiella michiganensis]|nr:phage tail protein [Klebsiella michiganensis]
QQYAQVQFLADDRQRNIGTFKAAKSQTFTLAHDASLPIYKVLGMADRYGQVLPLRMFVPNAKEYRYWSGVPSFDPQPVTAVNSVETVQVAFSIHSRDITFYKSED